MSNANLNEHAAPVNPDSNESIIPPLLDELAGTTDDNPFMEKPPVFPVEIYPPEVQEMIYEAAESFGTQLAVSGMAVLLVAAAMIGRSRGLVVKENSWIEHANIWLALVGKSGTGKSPVMKEFFKIIHAIEAEELRKFNMAMKEYEDDKCLAQPVLKQFCTSDATLEAVAEILSHNPKGILWKTDELAEMIGSFSRYKANGVKDKLLSAFAYEPWRINRINTSRNLYIPNACISLYGSIQPGRMAKIFSSDDVASGFLQRFLFVRIEREKPNLWNDKSFSDKSRETLRKLVNSLNKFEISYDEDSNEQIKNIYIGEEARPYFIDYYNSLANKAFQDDDGIFDKHKIYTARFILILHCINSIFCNESELKPISLDIVRKSIKLDKYFSENQRQCWQLATNKSVIIPTPLERAIMETVIENEAYIIGNRYEILNEILFQKVREKFPEHENISNDKFGRICTKINIKSCHIGADRGKQIPLETIVIFKRSVKSVNV